VLILCEIWISWCYILDAKAGRIHFRSNFIVSFKCLLGGTEEDPWQFAKFV
jgi:hypothetical protein